MTAARAMPVPHRSHEERRRTYGRVYYCHHFTRDLVWRDEWRHHANGTVAVQRALIVEPDPGRRRQALCRHVRPEAVRDIKGGKTVVIGNSRFDIVTEAELEAQVGDAAPDAAGRKAYMAGLTFRTTSIAKAAAALKAGKIAFTESAGPHRRAGEGGGERGGGVHRIGHGIFRLLRLELFARAG
jgi:hypothetical protein